MAIAWVLASLLCQVRTIGLKENNECANVKSGLLFLSINVDLDKVLPLLKTLGLVRLTEIFPPLHDLKSQ